MEKMAVTGGAGFIGSNLDEHLLDRGFSVVADISKATTMLGYQPLVNLENGLQRVLDWYRNQPSG